MNFAKFLISLFFIEYLWWPVVQPHHTKNLTGPLARKKVFSYFNLIIHFSTIFYNCEIASYFELLKILLIVMNIVRKS